MGNASGKYKGDNPLDRSLHELSGHGHLTEREASSAWYRYGVEVTDVYDVVEVLGQGHMGEVFTVRRKTTGHHVSFCLGRRGATMYGDAIIVFVHLMCSYLVSMLIDENW